MKKILVERVVYVTKALSETNRLKILKILASSMEDSVCVSDVAKILKISQPTATKHLRILENINLLKRKRIGPSVYYSLNEEGLSTIFKDLTLLAKKGYNKCPYNFQCEECKYGETCL